MLNYLDIFNTQSKIYSRKTGGRMIPKHELGDPIVPIEDPLNNTDAQALMVQEAKDLAAQNREKVANGFKSFGSEVGGAMLGLLGIDKSTVNRLKEWGGEEGVDQGLNAKGAQAMAYTSMAVDKGMKLASDLTTSDKNFDAQSRAIDSGANLFSSALMNTGNPWAMMAGAAVTTFNELDKMLGANLEGFSTDIKGSGYSSNLAHEESKAIRGTQGAWNKDKLTTLLDRRNERATMALQAADIASEQYETQTARQQSIDDLIQRNQQALLGGVDSSLLSAKQGGKLIQKAQDGAKLKNVEISEEENLLPTGSMHKNKHGLTDIAEEITKKGIPVITVKDDSAETYKDIIKQKDSIVQHAEIESQEILFNKEVTDFLEQARKEWEKTHDKEILLEVGKRITKEVLFNTKDKEGTIQEKLEE